MGYTEQQMEYFRNQYAIRRRRQLLLTIPLILLMVVYATSDKGTGLILSIFPVSTFAVMAIIMAIGALVFSYKNWRCPACDRYLGKNLSRRSCWHCGIVFR